MKLTRSAILLLAIFVVASGSPSHADTIGDAIDQQAKAVEAKMIAWRRDIHQNPELGNREFRTSALVVEHLRKVGYEVRDKVAHTGVVAVLKGAPRIAAVELVQIERPWRSSRRVRKPQKSGFPATGVP